MKKMIVLALTAAVAISACSVTAFAEEQAPAVVQNDVVYTEPDPFIIEMSASAEDGNGNTYKYTIIPEKESGTLPEIDSQVTWSDGTNTFVLNGSAKTVTVYDDGGNAIAVMPA